MPEAVQDPVMASDMIVDRRTGIFFHAGELRLALEQSQDLKNSYDDLRCLEVFREQQGKYLYLVEKFLASVSDPATLHVFSDFHHELNEAAMFRVKDSLRAMGKPSGSTLLFVQASSNINRINQVQSLGDGVQLAMIRQLAPGEQADRIDLKAWIDILSRSRQL